MHLERDLLVARADIDLESSEIDTLVADVNGLALVRVMPRVERATRRRLARGGRDVARSAGGWMGALRPRRLEYADWQTGELALDIGWDQGAAQIAGGGPGLNVRAELDSTGHLTAQADFADTLLRGVDGAVVALGGSVRWDGPLDSLDAVQADLALDSLLLRQGEWALQNYGPLQADYDAGRPGPHGDTPANASRPVGPFGLGRDGFALGCSGIAGP